MSDVTSPHDLTPPERNPDGYPIPNPVSTSIIRTVVPVFAGWLIALAAYVGLDLPTEDVALAVTPIATAAYYALFRWLESRVSPFFGWFLGRPTEPIYL